MPTADSTNPTGMTSLPSVKRSRGEDPYPVPSHRRNAVPDNYHDIEGWGADLDPANRPMVPKELPSDVCTVRGDVKHWQQPYHRVHISNEQPNLTPVFGTSCPPRMLSGRIRDLAFEYSEGTATHWMGLLFADRVDMVESMVSALLSGKPDNIFAEKAWLVRLTNNDPQRRKRLLVLGVAALMMGYRLYGMQRPGFLMRMLRMPRRQRMPRMQQIPRMQQMQGMPRVLRMQEVPQRVLALR